MIIVKLLHAPLTKNKKGIKIKIDNKLLIIKINRHYSEIEIYYESDWGQQYVYSLVLNTKNIKLISNAVLKTLNLAGNDSFVIAQYDNVLQLQKYIKIKFNCNLDYIDPRNPENWEKLAERCYITYYSPELYNFSDYSKYYEHKSINHLLSEIPYETVPAYIIYQAIDFIQKYGDDLSTYCLKYIINNSEILDKSMIKYYAEQFNINAQNTIDLVKKVCEHRYKYPHLW